MGRPDVIVLGGANGSGKSTVAPRLLKDKLGIAEFVNADLIAAGLSGFRPEGVALAAGRIMLNRLNELASRGDSFALETTLAGRSLAPWIRRLKSERDYRFRLVYIWLKSPELNVLRVAARVQRGGHDVPEETIRRRCTRSVKNLFEIYLPIADSWEVYDNSAAGDVVSVAAGGLDETTAVWDAASWLKLRQAYDDASG